MSLDLDKSAWKRMRFGDVIDSITDRVDDPSSAGVDRYVGLEHLDPGVMTVQRWDSPEKVEAQKLRFQPGDVIFGRRRAYQKKAARADFEGICSAHALVLRVKEGLMHPDFLPIFIASNYFLDRAIAISVGSLSPTVNWRDLKVQEFDLPPIEEQQRLADLLWAVESDRIMGQSLGESLESVRQTMVDGFLTSESEFVELSDVAEVTSGLTLGPARRALTETAPYLRVANVQRGALDLGEIKEIGVTDNEVAAKGLLPGDVLVVEGHASVDEIGRAASWTSDEMMVYQNHLFRVRPSTDYRAEFIREWINSLAGRSYMRRVSKSTSGLYTINSRVLKAMLIPLLSRDEQSEILESISTIDEAIRRGSERLAALRGLHTTFLTEIFGGN